MICIFIHCSPRTKNNELIENEKIEKNINKKNLEGPKNPGNQEGEVGQEVPENPEEGCENPEGVDENPEGVDENPEEVDENPEGVDKNPEAPKHPGNQEGEVGQEVPENPEEGDKNPGNQEGEVGQEVPENPEEGDKNPGNQEGEVGQEVPENPEEGDKNPGNQEGQENKFPENAKGLEFEQHLSLEKNIINVIDPGEELTLKEKFKILLKFLPSLPFGFFVFLLVQFEDDWGSQKIDKFLPVAEVVAALSFLSINIYMLTQKKERLDFFIMTVVFFFVGVSLISLISILTVRAFDHNRKKRDNMCSKCNECIYTRNSCFRVSCKCLEKDLFDTICSYFYIFLLKNDGVNLILSKKDSGPSCEEDSSFFWIKGIRLLGKKALAILFIISLSLLSTCLITFWISRVTIFYILFLFVFSFGLLLSALGIPELVPPR